MGGGGNETDVCPKFGLVNSTIHTIGKSTTKLISAKQQNGSKRKRIQKQEQCEVDDAHLEKIQQQSSDNVPVSEALHMITFVLPKY
jgi:hypothetical protein